MSFPDPHHDHAHCKADLIARAERTCARRGSKLTGQRRDVLACVAQGHEAVGAYDIIERMAEHGARPAPITVYRALEFLLGLPKFSMQFDSAHVIYWTSGCWTPEQFEAAANTVNAFLDLMPDYVKQQQTGH